MGWNQFQKKNKNIFKEIKDISFCLFFLFSQAQPTM